MFTGIVLAKGRLTSLAQRDGDLELGIDAAGLDVARIAIGDSVCVQGVCLTVTRKEDRCIFADVSRETMAKTTLATLAVGSNVNLEPSLRAGDALGGHMVSGHVDGVGRLVGLAQDARSWRLDFELPASLTRFVAAKGSICLDGVSLTVNARRRQQIRRQHHSAHSCGHDARRASRRRCSQRGNRRGRTLPGPPDRRRTALACDSELGTA